MNFRNFALPAAAAATLLAALNTAKDQYGAPPEPVTGNPRTESADTTDTPDTPDTTDTTPAYTSADAILDSARVFLHTAPDDRSGEDRSLVVVHVHADQLTSQPANPGDVPAGTLVGTSGTTQLLCASSETAAGVWPSYPAAAPSRKSARSSRGATLRWRPARRPLRRSARSVKE